MPFWPIRRPPAEGQSESGATSLDGDRALVAAARRNPAAFTPLYERYVQAVYRYCYVRLDDRTLAEDATSEVFLKALAKIDMLRDGQFVAWLFRIAHNVVADTYRRSRPATSLEFALELPDPAPDPETLVETRLDAAALRAAIALLPDEQRTVLELQLADWSGPQIADALGKSPAAVKMLRHRALQRLRTLLSAAEHSRNEAHDVER